MNFITYNQFLEDIKKFILELPRFDLVSYIPRSGMIPAFMYAKHHNVSVIDIGKLKGIEGFPGKKIIIFDDSVMYGRELDFQQSLISKRIHTFWACVYYSGLPSSSNYKLDFSYKLIQPPRLFEWNWLSHEAVKEMAFDMDGVLCRAPTQVENDDGLNYLNFIESADPLYNPKGCVGAIITARLEKYRKPTEEWLRQHGVTYKELIMLNSTAENRRRFNEHAPHKSSAYKLNSELNLFIEDEPSQAFNISQLSGKNVLCVSDWRIYGKNR